MAGGLVGGAVSLTGVDAAVGRKDGGRIDELEGIKEDIKLGSGRRV